MMKTTTVLIVEDSPTDAIKLEIILEELAIGHQGTVPTIGLAQQAIQRQRPSIVLVDIFLDGKPQGLAFLQYLDSEHIPAIVITSSQNQEVYVESMKLKNVVGYVVKPFYKYTLASLIENIVKNRATALAEQGQSFFFVKGNKNEQIRIGYNELIWMRAEGDYCYLFTQDKKYVVKKSLVKVLNELDERFVRIHKNCAININHVRNLQSSYVMVGDQLLSIGRTYKTGLKEHIQLVRNRK